MGRIARDSIEEVRRANDIVDLISSYLPLRRRGAGYWVNCPFHDEKTPSFQVSPTRQIYKCFGCGEFGTCIDFLMKYEKLEFVEAVDKLASRAGLTLRYEGGGPSAEDRSVRKRALEIMAWAQRGFESHLQRTPAALEYLNARGLGGEIARDWGLGYAPDEWTRVTDAARSKFDDEALLATGICRRNDEGRWYDFFRGRVTFPIRDPQGRIVAFGARLLDPEAKAQKYVNSMEGELFHKSRLLYAVDRLAESKRLKATGRALIMEGYTDVIMAHVHGFDNAVAPLGTALTRDQLGLLRRYTQRITLVLDGDAAGIKASERSIDVVLTEGIDADVAILPEGRDPFDVLRVSGTEAFQAALDAAESVVKFKIRLMRQRYDFKRPADVLAASDELATLLASTEDPRLRSANWGAISGLLPISESEWKRAINSIIARTQNKLAARRDGRDSESAGGRAEELRAGAPVTVAPSQLGHERGLIRGLLDHPAVLRAAGEIAGPEVFRTPALQELYRELLNAVDEHGGAEVAALLAHLGPEAREELNRIDELAEVPSSLSADLPGTQEDRLLAELRKLAAQRVAAPEVARGSPEELARLRQKQPRRAS